jgi:hypothetical protein
MKQNPHSTSSLFFGRFISFYVKLAKYFNVFPLKIDDNMRSRANYKKIYRIRNSG